MAEREKMTEYEWRRLENVKRNGEILEALMIHSRVNELSAAAKRQRGVWGWDDSYVFIGNMKRGIDVISVATLESELVSAIPCRFDAHPCNVGMLAGGLQVEARFYILDSRIISV